uniref:3-methyladenine DNA glycosylase AlkD n=1 Tax=Candidatus Kentrum sp. MB TaxID=2138164 RepID=A0A450X8V6_9GAMM|nr:MAG: 3-methyladenine DNA glycosylase AlkD [Candidatus Kentron sp. MB]VFK29669.1 MAG: 3-methyladenine DNA glycosylase AlkD [Candidatus Kentron sp. MB]VFK74865.1 MAG: 3-methyladenine DNA glycosylase AlkD [Candidatus Kentron sp. MB]
MASTATTAQVAGDVVERLRRSLVSLGDPHHAEGAKRYLGEKFRAYGVRGGKKEIARQLRAALRQHVSLEDEARMALAEALFASGIYEEGQAAILLLQRRKRPFPPETLRMLERWICAHVNNWGICDSFCIGVVCRIPLAFPDQTRVLRGWADSRNRWVRRAACVTMAKLCRVGDFAEDVIELSELLLARNERDDIVQKAWGWMLKELAQRRPALALPYFFRTAPRLPKLVLAQATERLPKSTRLTLRNQHANRQHEPLCKM